MCSFEFDTTVNGALRVRLAMKARFMGETWAR
jgi:hypothetical protein